MEQLEQSPSVFVSSQLEEKLKTETTEKELSISDLKETLSLSDKYDLSFLSVVLPPSHLGDVQFKKTPIPQEHLSDALDERLNRLWNLLLHLLLTNTPDQTLEIKKERALLCNVVFVNDRDFFFFLCELVSLSNQLSFLSFQKNSLVERYYEEIKQVMWKIGKVFYSLKE